MERTTRYSKKREAILELLRSTDCHPSAEWIYQSLRPSLPNLSLGTVYRNLTFFQEVGLVQSVGVVDGQERFDACVPPHSHFVCEHCSAVIDIPEFEVDSQLNGLVSTQYEFVVNRHELTFYGACKQCRNESLS